jgi:hypothetical protein
MKTFVKISVLLFLFSLQFFVSSVSACTIITATKGQKVFFGGNEDQWPNDSFLVVDRSGPLDVIFFATPWEKWPLQMQMGINEKGLCADANWIPKEKITSNPERTAQHEFAVVQILREASTVEEVLSKIFTYNFVDTISYQVHVADQSGDAAVIHPGENGKLTYTRIEKEKGYLISTNFNIGRLANNSWFCRRYKAADKMLSNIKTEKELTPEFMASVLKETHQTGKWKTIFSTVYDLQKLRIYLYYNRHFHKPYILDVEKELDKMAPHRYISLISLKELIANIKIE